RRRAMPNAFTIIDADAHVIETERTWDYLDAADRKFRPRLYSTPDDPSRQYWVIDDRIAGFRFLTLTERELHEFAQRAGRNFETPQAARALDDAEVALCRSWNRWLADISRKSAGRLFYSCVVPALDIGEAIAEVKFAKQNGAAAVCMRPLEGERHLSDPYFYPLYEAAVELDLAVAVHIANGNPENADLYRRAPAGRFAQFRVPTVTACFDVIMSELHAVFPGLRWGFIEASAQWVPWIQRETAIRYRAGGRAFPKNVFEEYNIFVTCQTNDDVPYIVRHCGENRLVIGT